MSGQPEWPRVVVQHDWLKRTAKVYCGLYPADGGGMVCLTTEGQTTIGEDEEAPLWFEVPQSLVESLAAQLTNRPAFSDRHLDDAIKVRDRLLTLVERLPAPVRSNKETEDA